MGSIPRVTEVRLLFMTFRPESYTFQVSGSSTRTIGIYHQNEYCYTVSCLHNVIMLILMCVVQEAPNCDMALVHDDDLERILRTGDGTVSKDHACASSLIASCP